MIFIISLFVITDLVGLGIIITQERLTYQSKQNVKKLEELLNDFKNKYTNGK
jgi:hypothetical protein